MRNRIKTIAVAALASALTVAGLAIAQGEGSGGDATDVRKRMQVAPVPGFGPIPDLSSGSALTYSETHVRRDGEDVTVRVDAGKVVAATATSIEIERNDGETVTVPVDDDTRVLAGPGRRAQAVADIAAGKRVTVIREDDKAAKVVAVLPKHPLRLRLRHRFGGPPPGGGMPPPMSDGDRG